MWRSDRSMLLVQAIRRCSTLSTLTSQLARSEDPSAIFQTTNGDVLRARSRRVPVLTSTHQTHREFGHAQLPFVDDPGSRWHAAEAGESTGVELAHHAGVDETEYDLAQLGCLLIDPEHAGDVRHVAAWYPLERNTDLPTVVRLAYHPEAVSRGELLGQQHRFVGGEIMPARLRIAEDVTIDCETHWIDRAEWSPGGDRKNVAVRADYRAIVIELRSERESLAD